MARPATAAVRLLTGEREPVRVATTADIVLHGLQAIDGVPAEIGDRVLVKDQADPAQNGIYTVSEGEWFRAADARTARTLQKGTTVHTQVGLANADRVFEFISDEPVVGTDAIAIAAFVPPDISEVVDEVEALRDETQVLKDAVEASAGQAAASASASAANAGLTAADVLTTAANLASAQAARDASLYGKGIFPTVAAAIGLGVAGSGAITAGAGGTNGIFDLAFAGGTGSGAAGRFVVAGGALTQILITAPGSYTVAPSFSFTASAGLAGASAAVVLGRNVDVGEYFWTEVSAGIMGMYQVTAGPVAVDTGVRASAAEVISLVGSRTVGPTVLTGAGSAASANVYYWPGSLATVDEYVTALPVAMSASGVVRVVVSTVEDDGTLSDAGVPVRLVNAPSGVSTISGLAIYKPAGCVVGVQTVSGGSLYFTAGTIPNGEARWHTAAVPTSHTAKTISTTNGVQWQAALTGEVTAKARRADAAAAAIGDSFDIGWPSLVNTGTDTPPNYSIIMETPAPAAGFITEVDVGADGVGAALIHVIEVLAGPTVNVISTTPINLSNGVVAIPLAIPIAAGQYPAISGGGYKFQANTNPEGIPVWLRNGVLSNGASVAHSVQHRYEVRFTIKTGLVADVARALNGGAQNTGMNLLADVDPNGVVDATAIFAAAAAAHPYPYVPLGTYSVTALPNQGKGFWGPGKVLVNGVLISLPEKPEFGSRFRKLRAAMMPQIATGSCLIINGDSISNGAFASNPRTNHVGLITRFANMGIALDEAVLVSFDNADTSGGNAFHGISFSNPSAPTYGANGPVGKSFMLQPAQVLNLDAGTYENIDLTYNGAASGQLSFAFNGTPYATVNTAGSGSDVLAAPGPTGQAGNGVYTITNTGAVAVEITSLMRFGVKAVGSSPRLYVCRMAHGSYTMASFTTARMQSMVRIATTIAGGTNHLVMPALGTNDAVGTNLNYAQMRQATLDYVGRWIAAGVPLVNILPIMPWRWSAYGTSNYQNELGGIRQAYRELGVRRVTQADAYDFVAEGLAGDGHPNDAGFIAEFNAIVASLCDGAI